MMKHYPIGPFVCAVAVAIAGCAPQPAAPPDTRAADEAAIRANDIAWAKVAGTKNVDAFVAYYSPDAILLPPNEPLATGKENIQKTIGGLLGLPGLMITWQPTKVDVARSGDLGYSSGTYELTFNDPSGKPVMDRGKYLEVWKKQPDGSWKCSADMFNSDVPVAPPPASK